MPFLGDEYVEEKISNFRAGSVGRWICTDELSDYQMFKISPWSYLENRSEP
jgi:hypothetical protein